MTLVLRVVRQPRWDWPAEDDRLPESGIPADPLADFAGTSGNELSVWFVDDDRGNLDLIVAAYAANRDKADKLDFVLFPEQHLRDLGLDCRPDRGNTPDDSANVFHHNLSRLFAEHVLALTVKVWHDHQGTGRRDKATIVDLIAEAVGAGRIELSRLKPKLREDVDRRLSEKDNLPRAPK